MNRPQNLQDRAEVRALRRDADARARRTAAVARRGASARRRALLTLVLALGGIAGWLDVGLGGLAIGWALGLTAALLGVLGLGRRAVVLNGRADAAWQLRTGATSVRPPQRSVTGRATIPSDLATAAVRRVGIEGRPVGVEGRPVGIENAPAAQQDDDAVSAAGWAPVPVPRPTYTLKPAAPRRDPAPLAVELPAVAGGATSIDAPAVAGGATSIEAPAVAAATPGGLDLDAILARRRASGE